MIKGYVNGQQLSIDQPVIAGNSLDYLTAKFTFYGHDWDGAAIFAHFSQGEKNWAIMLHDGEIIERDHLNLTEGIWNVCLHGNRGKQRITTTVCTLTAQAGCGEGGSVLPDTPLPPIEQIAGKAEEAKKIAQSVRDDANAGVFDGADGTTPHIGTNGNWFIEETDTGVKAEGKNGTTPSIGKNGNWYIGELDTGVKAQGPQGNAGTSPHIGDNGNWFVGPVDTTIKAQGPKGDAGDSPNIGANGNWYIGETDTGVKARGPQGIPGLDGVQIDDATVATDKTWSSSNIINKLCDPFSVSGAFATCNPVDGYPLHVVSEIVPVQEGSGDPSPDNIRPITGWTEAKLTQKGKNLFDGINFEYFLNTGVNLCGKDTRNTGGFIRTKPGWKVKITSTNSQERFRTATVDSLPDYGSPNFVIAYDGINADGRKEIDFVCKDHPYLIINATRLDEIMVSIDGGEFEPYIPGNEYTADFGQTVYGGSYDWQKGKLVPNRTIIPIEQLQQGFNAAALRDDYFRARVIKGKKGTAHALGICNILPSFPIEDGYNAKKQGIYVTDNIDTIIDIVFEVSNLIPFGAIHGDRSTYLEAAQKYLKNNNAVLLSGIWRPDTVVSIDPQPIPAIAGVNTLYTDTGDTSASGREDPRASRKALADRIALLEKSVTEI